MTAPLPSSVSYVGRITSLTNWGMLEFSTNSGTMGRVPLPAGVTTAMIMWSGTAKLILRPAAIVQATVEGSETRKVVTLTAKTDTFLDVQIYKPVQADLGLEVGIQLVTIPLGPS